MVALKKIMVLQAALLVLAVLVVSAKADRLDFFKLLTSNDKKSVDVYKRPDIPACCDKCVCTKSIQPQCRCTDIFTGDERCENCEQCRCTRSFPPQCQCRDIKDYCDPPCSYSSTVQIIKQVAA
ncbi:Bowman-Birk type proteinase inhibitor [Ziziphus jujuba]|uniref:Bowman-Birk type proteinase inhibitor n=1 Tax=Ziziphus jujuba TaxID=326968 RepID=A0ABM3IKT6_ZIZJJ|nr:Bowman-Birk type proteinase inhibitor [Ziziphus jujuba]